MKLRQLTCMLMACALVLGSIISPVQATDVSDEAVIWLEDLEWEWIDLSELEYETGPMPLTTDKIDKSISQFSIVCVPSFMDFDANDLVTFNCSYSPSSASVDFGVISSAGKFYSINGKEGSINQAIRINQAGKYAVAIRNNSSQTVSVVGFVNY